MKINANISALYASHNINITNAKMSQSLDRLSSGKRINNVSDDPTGLAITNKLQAQLNGLKNASRNSSDAISMLQTAEGAMNEVHEMLKRMRELTLQSANGVWTPDDRDKIQAEVQQLVDEIAAIPSTTEFNTMKLLSGTLGRMNEFSTTATLTYGEMPSLVYMSTYVPAGDYEFSVTAPAVQANTIATYSNTGGTLVINGETITIEAGESNASIEEKILETAKRLNMDVTFAAPNQFTLTNQQAGADHQITLGGNSFAIVPAIPPATNPTPGADASVTLTSGFSAGATHSVEGNRVTVRDKDGFELVFDLSGQLMNNFTAGPYNFTFSVDERGPLVIHTGPNMDMRTELIIPTMSAESLGLTMSNTFKSPAETVYLLNVASEQGAQAGIAICDEAVAKVSTMRAILGAYSNRMDHKVISLDNTTVNTQEAQSRILDTDMAAEMTEYTLRNVILKSAISVLAQANEQPGMLLQLLR